mgnify:CR=1 FL=1
MGVSSSSPKYSSLIMEIAEQKQLGTETVQVIYQKFCSISNNKDKIPVEDFSQFFEFSSKQIFENLIKYIRIKDNVYFCDFVEMYLCLLPNVSNDKLSNLIYHSFLIKNEFSYEVFINELRFSGILTDKNEEVKLTEMFKAFNEDEPINNLLKESKIGNVSLLDLGRQLIFSKFI